MTNVVFGETSVSGYVANFYSDNDQWATKFTLTGSDPSALLTKITAYMSTRGGSLQNLAVWRDAAGVPGALVGYGLPSPAPGAAGFYDVSSPTLVDLGGLMPDGDYWLGFRVSGGLSENLFLKFTGATSQFRSGVGGTLPTDPFGSGSATAFGLCMNATVSFTVCAPPQNAGGSALPFITGTPEVGQVLTAHDGTWTGDPTIVFTYQWQIDCSSGFINILGEVGSTYTVDAGDVGCDIRVRVTGTNSCSPPGVAFSLADHVNGPPVNTVPPVIVGVTQPGHSLMVVSDGSWTESPTSFAYEWFEDDGGGFLSTGNLTNTIALVDADIGSFFKCEVTASN